MANDHETRPQAAVDDNNKPGGRLALLSRWAGTALLAERAWPPIVAAAAIALLFLALSWTGLWLFAPRAIRAAGVIVFALAVLAALAPLVRLRWPSARDITARLDRAAGAAHRPATSLSDTLANDSDPVARALWEAHRARLVREVNEIRVAPPAPRMAERDPYALRFAVALIAFAAAIAAGPELYGRLAAAFDWRGGDGAIAAAGSRINAWINPPPYAGRPPVVIDVASAEPQTLSVFEDSTLVVRGEPGVVETRVEGPITPLEEKGAAPSAERRWTIHGDGKATILRGGAKTAEVAFSVTPAGVPTIKLTEEPIANLSGTMTLAYHIEDRYGIAGARADFALPHDASKPAQRTLAEPPQAALDTPATANGAGDAKATIDLAEHPWAGAKVQMTLSATSVSGKTGTSAPVEVTLPQRPFHNPLARALVEQRRDIILDPDHAPKRVGYALTGLSVAPELFGTPAAIYLGLRQAKASLDHARGDPDLVEVASLLWAMALQLENGDATAAERDLRAAEQALRDALKRGASDDEIKKLMENLREAAKRFANELARNAQEQDSQSSDESAMQAQDLDKLMDRMEDAARNGTREDAEAMLDQMQEMFENMRGAQDAQESAEERKLRKQIDELGKLLRDQQALRDDTFKSDQRDQERKHKRRRPQAGQQDGQGQPNDGDQQQSEGKEGADSDQSDDNSNPGEPQLEQRQRALRDRLAEMERQLKSLGMKGEKGFGEAEKDMQEAEGDLQGDQGKPGEGGQEGSQGKSGGKGAAVDAQGRALQALREGAQGVEKQIGQGQGQGQGRGKGYTARRGRPGGKEGDDPLGRGQEGNQGRQDGPLREMGGGPERARRVLEELRRRLADPSRPQDERDYLERLMKRD